MSFDAGSITASLELDRSPFVRGLEAAKEDARRFSEQTITPTVDIDTAKADAEIEATQVELDKLDHTTARPDVKVDTHQAGQGIGLLAAAIIALGPAAIAAGGVAAGALAPIAVGVLGVSAVAIPALKNIEAAANKTGAAQQKALMALGPGANVVVAAFRALDADWKQFQASINPALFALLASTFQLIGASLPALAPLFTATAHALTALVQGLTPLAPLFGRAFAQMSPIITAFTAGLLHMAQALANWTQGAGFEHFIAYVLQTGPQLVHALSAIGGTFIAIGQAGAVVLPTLLAVITAVANLITTILHIPLIGPALVTLAGIAVIASKVGGALLSLGQVFGIAALEGKSAMGALGVAAKLLMGDPIVAVAVAIGAALLWIGTHWQQTVQFLESLWRGALDVYNSTIGLIPGLHIGGGNAGSDLQHVADLAAAASHGDQKAFAELQKIKAAQQGPQAPSVPALGAMPTIGGVTQMPALTSPAIGKVPKITVPKVNVPKIGTVHVPGVGPVAALPVAAIPHTGGTSLPHATGGTQQAITGGGLAGPRTITDDFGLGPDIVGQTVQFRHSPNYGQHTQDKHTTAVDKNTRAIQKMTDHLEKQGRGGAAEVIKLNIGNRSEQISTEIRRRGRAPGKR